MAFLQEFFSIFCGKPYRTTSYIHTFVVIVVLISYNLLWFTPWINQESVFVLLGIGFIVEAGVCIYEIVSYVIKPLIKLFKSGLASSQKFKTIFKAYLYVLAYRFVVVCFLIMLCYVVLLIVEPSFKKIDDYGDVYYDYGPGGFGNVALLITGSLLPFILILLTFCMNIIHYVIENKIRDGVNEFDNLLETQSVNEKSSKKGCIIIATILSVIMAFQIGIVFLFRNSQTLNDATVGSVKDTAVVEEEFDKMLYSLDSLGAIQEHIDYMDFDVPSKESPFNDK